MSLKGRIVTGNTPLTAQEAYNVVSMHLIKHAKDIDNADDAYNALRVNIEPKIGRYSPALDMMIRVYYNIEDFAADGEPMDQVWADIEEIADHNDIQ